MQDHLTGRRIGIGRRVGGLYHHEHFHLPTLASASICASDIVASVCFLDRWHCRLGHLSSAHLKLLANSGTLSPVTSSPLSSCKGCRLAKHLALPFSSSEYISSASFDLVHSDVWGPAPSSSLDGFSYYVCFIDFSRYTWLSLIRS